MELEKFKKIKSQLIEAFAKAILKAAEEHPEGFKEWLGIGYKKSPENPCDEEYMKEISGV